MKRVEIYPMYYIHDGDKMHHVERSHMLDELKKTYPNAEEVLKDIETNDKVAWVGKRAFSVAKSKKRR